MLTPEKQAIAMMAVRDQMEAALKHHETEAHGGKPCAGNRASAIAYLAHCLGVCGELWDYAGGLREQYDANCKGPCEHGNKDAE